MKLKYEDLISPSPKRCQFGEGFALSIKCPTLREIDEITYTVYERYLYLLLLTPEQYFKSINEACTYEDMPEEIKEALTMYDLILKSDEWISLFTKIFTFFLADKLMFNPESQVYCAYNGTLDPEQKLNVTGLICKENYHEVCSLILQRNNITKLEEDTSSVKNKLAKEIVQKLKQGRNSKKKNTENSDKLEFGNLISSLASYHKSLNIINIWNLTIFQLYDQFNRQNMNILYDIESASVAAWGDKDKKFDLTAWYKQT